MNAVEIEESISALAAMAFDPAEFPYAFLAAFGNKETTIKRLRKGESNKSDVGGVLHIYAALAEQERRLIRQRTSAGLQAVEARGKRLGNPTLKAKPGTTLSENNRAQARAV